MQRYNIKDHMNVRNYSHNPVKINLAVVYLNTRLNNYIKLRIVHSYIHIGLSVHCRKSDIQQSVVTIPEHQNCERFVFSAPR